MRKRNVGPNGQPVKIEPAKCCFSCKNYGGGGHLNFGFCEVNTTVEVNGPNEVVSKSPVSDTDTCPSHEWMEELKEGHDGSI